MARSDNTPAMQFIRIINWSRFQHYKHRNPPWIKLHRELLSSRTWVTVDDASRVLAVTLMLLAGEHDNKIPFDTKYLMRVGYLNEEPDLSGLLDSHFIEIIDSASKPLAPCKQDASNLHQNADSETETETEEEKYVSSEFSKNENSKPAESLISFPCAGKIKSYAVTQSQIDQWRQDFPGLKIGDQLHRAHAWLLANHLKTAKGMPRFLVGWFGRSQDRGHASNRNGNGRTSLADTVQREREEMVHAAVSKR